MFGSTYHVGRSVIAAADAEAARRIAGGRLVGCVVVGVLVGVVLDAMPGRLPGLMVTVVVGVVWNRSGSGRTAKLTGCTGWLAVAGDNGKMFACAEHGSAVFQRDELRHQVSARHDVHRVAGHVVNR